MTHSLYRKRPLSEINVVPYIDVMLVLLIIFMITTPLLTQGVKIDLPKEAAQALTHVAREPVIVSVTAQGQYYLNVATHPNQPMTAHVLMTRVAAELALARASHQSLPILIKGDQHTPYGNIVHAMVLLQHAGAKHIGLMTQPSERQTASRRG